ncbi:sulfatase [Kiritimatiella glycovorans]|uniref:Arylsulfatase n=1 Tax=Kiritimatiella glycovorans TaxID=1307763 RepID=A0A0G3EIH4_9BACT|nr:sulfatase [Kiritimatiella glycovorans]AKJ64615.1 Arylsulfatase [Kiritimatiella glycovorans]
MNKTDRPNILLAIADDASHMSACGDRFLTTPGFDRVAREGVRFTAAFTTNPKCAPSRASLLTGRHTWQLEEACNHFSLFPDRFAVYPDLLEAAGYHIGFTGKGWAPGNYEAGGFSHNPAGHEWNARTLTPPADSMISSTDYTANFEAFLSARPEGAPFCFWYGGREPHRAYVPGEGRRGGKDPDTVEVPPYLPDDAAVREDLCDYAYEIEWFDAHLVNMMRILEDRGELDRTLVIVTSDNGMPFPRVKGQMYDYDFRMPLAIRGPDVAKPGRVADDLVSFIDFAPTILDAAGLPPHEQMRGRSLMPLLRSGRGGAVGGDRTRAYMGRELHDLGREGDVGYPVRCIRTPRYLYVRNYHPERWPAGNPETLFTNCDGSPTKDRVIELHETGVTSFYYALAFGKRPAEELYDIVEDPSCMTDLAARPEYAGLKEQLRTELEDELRETGDPRVFGNGDIFDRYPTYNPTSSTWKRWMDGTFEISDHLKY